MCLVMMRKDFETVWPELAILYACKSNSTNNEICAVRVMHEEHCNFLRQPRTAIGVVLRFIEQGLRLKKQQINCIQHHLIPNIARHKHEVCVCV